MGLPTTGQRLDLLEEKLATVEDSLKLMVEKAVGTAMDALRHSLTEVVLEGQSIATKQMGVELEALAGRLEGRINRSREYQESLISTLRNEQLKFQADVKSTLLGMGPDKGSSSVHSGGQGPGNHNSALGDNADLPKGSNDRNGSGVGSGGHGGGLFTGNSNWRYRKLDMPIFDGADPDGWVLRAERYFHFYRMSEEEMLDAAAIAMDRDALRWY